MLYTIDSTLLTNIADAIRAKNDNSNATYTPAQMESAILALPTYHKIGEKTITASTTSTTATDIDTINLGSGAYVDKIVYMRVRDTAGPRAGYFAGSDHWYMNYMLGSGKTSNIQSTHLTWALGTNGSYTMSTTAYGVYCYTITNAGVMTIRTRYNSTYSLTINGTYKIEVFLLDFPTANGSPWA